MVKKELRSFLGGIHPSYLKELTQEKEVKRAEVPDIVYIPLVQHIGAPANPIVKVGDVVKMGQKIGEGSSFISANIHSTVSGKVTAVEKRAQAGGIVSTVVIESDGQDEWVEGIQSSKDVDKLLPEEMLEMIKEAGIVGMGGAAFPTHIKLSPPKDQVIDTVILNGAECEPYLTADHRLMVERAEEVVGGLEIILKILGAGEGVIGIENNKPDAIAAMEKACSEESGIKVVVLETKYPQGGEKQLIKAVTGREVPSKALPSKVGCVVSNVGTAAAIYAAVRKGIPPIERIVTVSGGGVTEPQNLLVRIGTSFEEVISQCGGLREDCAKVISGGPMMGIAQASLNASVVKGTSGILALTLKETEQVQPYPCIKCARCVDVCPIGLMPVKIANAVEAGDIDQALKLNIMDCIECGSCSFICPAKRHLLQYIRVGKAKIRSKN